MSRPWAGERSVSGLPPVSVEQRPTLEPLRVAERGEPSLAPGLDARAVAGAQPVLRGAAGDLVSAPLFAHVEDEPPGGAEHQRFAEIE